MRPFGTSLLILLSGCFSPSAVAQQVADTGFRPAIDNPRYALGAGPAVLIDEAHSNFHTAIGRYLPFAELLRRDGYAVRGSPDTLTAEVLGRASMLVTVSAQQAFTASEVAAVRDWVRTGGALLLIVDHPPFVRATAERAAIFGIHFLDCGASYPGATSGRLMCRRSDSPAGEDAVMTGSDSVTYGPGGKLADHAVTTGVDSVMTFLGSAFRVERSHVPLLLFGRRVECWGRTDLIARAEGLLQGALLECGSGRIAVFGEAAMFTAQLNIGANTKMGLNNPLAADNSKFLLNVAHWLTWVSERH